MQLTEHTPGDYHVVRRIQADRIDINQQSFESSLILGARLLETDWPVHGYDDLTETTIEPLLTHHPEVVLLGYGARQSFPPVEIQRQFLRVGIGLECMTLDAAARTFNVLMSENRRALAGFILPRTDAG
jgi:uncharacterized protein